MDTHFYLLQKYKGFFWGFYSRGVVDNEYHIIFLASASPQLYQDALNFYQGWKIITYREETGQIKIGD